MYLDDMIKATEDLKKKKEQKASEHTDEQRRNEQGERTLAESEARIRAIGEGKDTVSITGEQEERVAQPSNAKPSLPTGTRDIIRESMEKLKAIERRRAAGGEEDTRTASPDAVAVNRKPVQAEPVITPREKASAEREVPVNASISTVTVDYGKKEQTEEEKKKQEEEKKKKDDFTVPPSPKEMLDVMKGVRKFDEAGAVEIEGKRAKVLDNYSNITIYRVEGKPLPYYVTPASKLGEAQRSILKTIKEAATRVIPISPEELPISQRKQFFMKKITEMLEKATDILDIPIGQERTYAEMAVREMIGYGNLDFILADDGVEEIMLIGISRPVYIFHRKWGMCETNIIFNEEQAVIDIIDRIARDAGKRVDKQSPLLDSRLPDGSRVNATIPPISLEGPTLTIRKFKENPLTVANLLKYRTLNAKAAAFLWLAVDGLFAKPANILIAGGTGSGKTTTLNVLANFIPAHERVITIEDTAELKLPIEHWVRMETRAKGLEGSGEVSMSDLTINSLRMRPDRVIVGEVRGPEANTLLTAMNTGHEGCLGTIHSNSAKETITRLISEPMNVPPMMLHGLDIILVQNRIHSPKLGTIRRVVEIGEVDPTDEGVKVRVIYKWNSSTDELEPTGERSRVLEEIADLSGRSMDDLKKELEKREKVISYFQKEQINDVVEIGRLVNEYHAGRLNLD